MIWFCLMLINKMVFGFVQFIFVREPPILFVTLVTCSRNLRFNNLNKLVVSIQFRRAMKWCFVIPQIYVTVFVNSQSILVYASGYICQTQK
jgi:hypothetical protein